MSSRRLARAGLRKSSSASSPGGVGTVVGGVPWELTTAGRDSRFWEDRDGVAAFVDRHGLDAPNPFFWSSSHALRDHCAYEWLRRNGYGNGWGHPDWERAREVADVPPAGGARLQARFAGMTLHPK